ncbi:hypothetical protein CsSME_00042081 [Camellia sinensis var. sinensis]
MAVEIFLRACGMCQRLNDAQAMIADCVAWNVENMQAITDNKEAEMNPTWGDFIMNSRFDR